MPYVPEDSIIPIEEYVPQNKESFAEVCDNLMRLSARLMELLPDITLGPDERLERLGRVVPQSSLVSKNMRTARVKLQALRTRLRELVPDPALTDDERLEWLVKRVHELVPEEESRLFIKLEKIGDYRGSDTGR